MRPDSSDPQGRDRDAPAVAPQEPTGAIHAPWSAWPGQFLAFLRADPRWVWVPLAIVAALLLLLIAFGPDVDARFDYTLF